MSSALSRGLLATATSLALVTAVPAGEADHAGTYAATITRQEARPLGSPDRLLVAQVAQGSNRSTGATPFMEGAQAIWSETVELDKGNGPQRGMISLIDARGSTTSEYSGTLTTTMEGGQPRTTGQGTWRTVSGTGAYAGSEGSGTYTFTMTSQTAFTGAWKGKVSLARR